MSANLLRLIPTDPGIVPGENARRVAFALFRATVPRAHKVREKIFEEVTFVDQGGNFESVSCPHCRKPLDTPTWQDLMDSCRETRFGKLDVTMPCCGRRSSLNDLDYYFPAGFARYCLEARNPYLSEFLAPEIVQSIEQALGCKLRQIFAHY